MKELLALVLVAFLAWTQKADVPESYAERKQELEAAFAQGSYELAQRGYAEIDIASLPAAEARWVLFRRADTQWRSRASTANPDSTEVDRARVALEELQRTVERPEERDETWALVEESLGDWHWIRRDSQNLGAALPHYRAALDWWAGAASIEKARERYLGIVFRMAMPVRGDWGQSWWLGQVPPELFENAIRIANDPADKARAQYHFALATRQRGGDFGALRRGLEALAQAIEAGRDNPWFDDALFAYAQWLEQQGRPRFDDAGQWRQEPDYAGALSVYRRIVATFRKGESAYYDPAREGIERILRTELSVSVPSAYLPGSEVAIALAWRNVDEVELALYPVDLTRAVALRGSNDDWLATIDLRALEPFHSWKHATKSPGKHHPGQAALRVAAQVPAGAYVVEARAGGERARDVVLVGRSSLFVKSTAERALVWFCDALSSAPIANARVRVWAHSSRGDGAWKSFESETRADGTALFELEGWRSDNLFVAAQSGERAAFSRCANWHPDPDAATWKLLAFTDRSAYRPEDTVRWKAIARTRANGVYATPAGGSLEYEIVDPRGAVTSKGSSTLNEFGSAWGQLATNASMPLGEYSIRFFATAKQSRVHIGGAALFRLEEYKLPEFQVAVEFPKENGRTKLFRTGDQVEVDVTAELYAGGAVAGADVEVLVHQKPYWRRWVPVREYAWLHPEPDQGYRHWGPGQIVRREKLTTDATGRARLVFDTPANAGEDYEFTIEARVTDASRREVSGSGVVRVMRDAYAVDARTTHKLYRPGDAVEVLFEAKDANDNPVEAEGRVVVTRQRWVEIWIDPQGREMRASEFEKLRGGNIPFPPPPVPGERPWQLKFRGYEIEEVAAGVVTTNARGEARYAFTPLAVGYYRAAWTSRDDRGVPIRAETAVWVLSGDTRDLGYHAGGLEIVVDKESFRAGETAPVMLTLPASNRWVLFAVETDELLSWQVVHVEGRVRLVELAIGPEHVPNVFLSAATAHEGDALVAVEEIVVPPVDQFLSVELSPDRAEVQPGEKDRWNVVVKDKNGEPVAAEVALAVVDEAVLAIQQEYPTDPRQFFFGERRVHATTTRSSFEERSYRRLVVGAQGELRDERQASADESERDGGGRLGALGYVEGKDLARGAKLAKSEQRSRNDMNAPTAAREMADMAAAPALQGGAGEVAVVVVRSNFDATALWQPAVVTGADGRASVELTYPDSLTRWKATARVAGRDARFGIASAAVRAQKPLTARLQAPRFFVVGDRTVVSGVVANRTSEPLTVVVSLAAPGMRFGAPGSSEHLIEAGGEIRVDWTLEPVEAGRPTIRLTARAKDAPSYADAMEKSYPIEPHGIEAYVARSLALRPDPDASALDMVLDVPAARRRESTVFSIQVAPSLAVTMLDALPYLVEYPYGCTEQTLSRFLPAAIVARTLEKRGLSAEDAMSRVFGGIEPESASATHPRGKRGLHELDAITRAGLQRLYEFQRGDGGWGWWKTSEGDPYMTAYVVWGLSLARDAGVEVDHARIARGAQWLALEIVEAEKTPDLAAWMLHAIAAAQPEPPASNGAIGDARVATAFANLWQRHTELNAYGRALFALAAHGFGKKDEARLLARNLANGAQIETPDVSRIGAGGKADPRTQKTAHWGAERGWWRWSEGAVESTAFALRALVAIDPKNELVLQATSWLVANRRGAQWSSTKDTAIAVLALDDYLDASGELARDVEYELSLNGKTLARKKVSASEMLAAPNRFDVAVEDVLDGANVVRLARVAGEGPLYLSARAEFFSLEEPIPARGSEIFVRRQYFKLVGRPTLLKGLLYDKVALEDGGSVASGERVEVVLTLESKNDYEYLVFEDLKPAGLEAAALKSGEFMTARELKSGEVDHRFAGGAPAFVPEATDWERYTGRQQHAHQELRDRKVAVFLDRLPQGVWEVRYELRAEVPGSFHALPVLGHAMYVPEIRCNGAETRIEVTERNQQGQ